MSEILRAIILPIGEIKILLPQLAITEILTEYSSGELTWRDQQIPIISWDQIEEIEIKQELKNKRIAIINEGCIFWYYIFMAHRHC